MKMTHNKKTTSFILCMVLIVAMALCISGCNGNAGSDISSDAGANVDTRSDDNVSGSAADTQGEISVLGTGSTQFALTVTNREGSETQFEIHTDKETVGEALLELGLIDGEESGYGLYVKTVNGITADYDKDGTYWAFYINGEYASSGVDTTAITEGDGYAFKVE